MSDQDKEINLVQNNTLVKQMNLLRDQNDQLNLENRNIRSGLDEQLTAVQSKIQDIDQLFKVQYAEKVKNLDEREEKIRADEDKIDQRVRDLAAQEKELNEQSAKQIADTQTLLEQNQDVLEKNKAILQHISDQNAAFDQKKNQLQIDSEELARQQQMVDQKSEKARTDMAIGQSLQEEALKLKQDAIQAVAQANDLLQQANVKHDEVSTAIRELDQKQVTNDQQLAQIKAASDELEAQRIDIQKKLDEQNQNMITMQHITERNQTDLIKLRTQEIALKQLDRDVSERLKNVKALESQAQL